MNNHTQGPRAPIRAAQGGAGSLWGVGRLDGRHSGFCGPSGNAVVLAELPGSLRRDAELSGNLYPVAALGAQLAGRFDAGSSFLAPGGLDILGCVAQLTLRGEPAFLGFSKRLSRLPGVLQRIGTRHGVPLVAHARHRASSRPRPP